jgi:hypothetical protein
MIDAGVPPGHIVAIDDDSSDRTNEVMFLASSDSQSGPTGQGAQSTSSHRDPPTHGPLRVLFVARRRQRIDYFEVVVRSFDQEPGSVLTQIR